MAAAAVNPKSQSPSHKLHAKTPQLPTSIIFQTFTFLSVQEVCIASRSCREFYQTSKIETLWRKFYCEKYLVPQFPEYVNLRKEVMALCSFSQFNLKRNPNRIKRSYHFLYGIVKMSIDSSGFFVSVMNHGVVHRWNLQNTNRFCTTRLSVYKAEENFEVTSIYKSDLFAKNLLIVARRQPCIEIWKVDTKEWIATTETAPGEVLGWDFHDTTLTYSVRGGPQNLLCEWDYVKGTTREIIKTEKPITHLKYLKSGEYTLTFSDSMQLCQLGNKGWTLTPCLERRHTSFSNIRDVDISGDYISFINSPSSLEIWNYREKQMHQSIWNVISFQRIGSLLFIVQNFESGTKLEVLSFPGMNSLKSLVISKNFHQHGAFCVDLKESRILYLQTVSGNNFLTFSANASLFTF